MDHYFVYLVGPVSCGYDEHDSFVVVASSEDEARQMADSAAYSGQKGVFLKADVVEVGKANDSSPGVILGSFNAG